MSIFTQSKLRQRELNTLSCIVTGLIGWKTTIELQNDAFVVGEIVDADAMMNIDLINAKYTDGNGYSQNLDNFHINGRKIRVVHIPDQIDSMKLIKKQVTIKPKRTLRPTIKELKMRKKDIQTVKRFNREQVKESKQ